MKLSGPMIATSIAAPFVLSTRASPGANTSPDTTGNIAVEHTYEAEGNMGLSRRLAEWINRIYSRSTWR